MDENTLVLIALFVTMFIFFVFARKASGRKKKEPSGASAEAPEKETGGTMTSGTSADTDTGKKEHTAATIYMYTGNADIWVCPVCETENPSTYSKCRICHAPK